MANDDKLPSPYEKPPLLDWLETFFPFKFPRIPLVQTAKNLDKAVASVVLAGGDNVAARIRSSTTRIDAKSAAEKAFIELGRDSIALASGEVADRAILYAIGDAVSKQKNREQILRIAADHLEALPPKDDAAAEIDEDWLSSFNKFAETKSKADIQELWARILSEEIRKPGSISLRTLAFLSTASTDDAKKIVEIFSFVINGVFIPQFVNLKKLIAFPSYLSLEVMGILSGGYGVGGTAYTSRAQRCPSDRAKSMFAIHYFEKAAFLFTDDENHTLKFGAGVLTELGSALFSITDAKRPNYDFFEAFVLQLGTPPIKEICIFDSVTTDGKKISGRGVERIVYPATTAA